MKTLKVLAAGVAVYLGAAACSAASSTQEKLAHTGGAAGSTSQSGGAGGAPGGSAAGGQLSGGSGGLLDSGLDAFADAMGDAMVVPDADAAPAPTVVTAQCDKTFRGNGVSYDTFYAEAAFPGASVTDLAGATVVMTYADAQQIPGYTSAVSIPQVRPGFAAVLCGYDLPGSVIPTSVTFILP